MCARARKKPLPPVLLKDFFKFLKDSSCSLRSVGVNAKFDRSSLLEINDWPELARQAHYRAAELAAQGGVSRRELERFFHDCVGQTPQRWLA